MANWYVTDSTYEIVGGTAYAGQTVDLTISPVNSDGVHSGAFIQASNFKIGGATESPTNQWNGGNVTTGIVSVAFSDLGTAGDINNTVRARVRFASSGNFPTSVADFVIDIDENSSAPPGLAPTEALSFKVQYPFFEAGQGTPVITNIADPDITESSSGGSVGNDYVVALSGNLTVGDTIHILQTTFTTSSSSYYYEETPTVYFQNVGEFSGWYSSDVVPTFTNGLITSFVVNVYYTIPSNYTEVPVANDNHVAYIHYKIHEIVDDPNDGIDDVDIEGGGQGGGDHGTLDDTNIGTIKGKIPYYGGNYDIIVKGKKDTKYILNLDKRKSLTSKETAHSEWVTDVTPSHFGNPISYMYSQGGGNFDFGTGAFVNFETGSEAEGAFLTTKKLKDKINHNSGIISSKGVQAHNAVFSKQYVKRRYDVTVEPNVKGSSAKFSSKVPTKPGDFVIIQYGLKRLDLRPITYDFASDVTISSAIQYYKPERYDGDPYGDKISRQIVVKGGTAGAASTVITLQEENADIQEDMLLGGINIGDDVLVTRVNSNKITVNKSVTIADDSSLTFNENNSVIYPYSFTISPVGNKVLSVARETTPGNARQDLKLSRYLGGNTITARAIDSRVSTTINLNPSIGAKSGVDAVHIYPAFPLYHGTRGIVPGMKVEKNGVKLVDASGNDIVVASVTDHDTFVLSGKATVELGQYDTVTISEGNEEVELISINTVKSGNDIIISGAIKIRNLSLDPPSGSGIDSIASRADLYLDSLINVHN